MSKIDIIIPAWKAQQTMMRCLSSIAAQTIAHECNVIIVNDGEPNDPYGQFQFQFQNAFSNFKIINEISNGGPGVARQIGMDASSSEYLTFIDADDTFAGPFALESLLRVIEQNPKLIMVGGTFVEQQEHNNDLVFIPHQNDMIWVFGKVYRRSKLADFNVRFLDGSRANEDNGFNTTIRLLADEEHQLSYIESTVYVWMATENSITHAENYRYTYDQSFVGYVDNMIYAIQNYYKFRPYNTDLGNWIANVMARLYVYLIETEANAKHLTERNFNLCYKFYSTCFRNLRGKEPMFREAYNNAMLAGYESGRLNNSFPSMTPKSFLLRLEQKFIENTSADNTK